MGQYKHSQVVRLTDEQVELLEQEAERQGCSKSDVIRNCITNLADVTQCDTSDEVEPSAQSLALLDQLATKDEQIAGLIRALETAQETVKAAQALQAASGGALAIVESKQEEPMSRWKRLRRAWKG